MINGTDGLTLGQTIGGVAILSSLFKDSPPAVEILESARRYLMDYEAQMQKASEEPDDGDPFAEPPGAAAEDFWDDSWPLEG